MLCFLFPFDSTSFTCCCSSVCFSVEDKKFGLIYRKEPSGTHVDNVEGGGGVAMRSGTGRVGPLNDNRGNVGHGLDAF